MLPIPALHPMVYRSSPRAERLLAQPNQGIIILRVSGRSEAYFRQYLPEGSGLL